MGCVLLTAQHHAMNNDIPFWAMIIVTNVLIAPVLTDLARIILGTIWLLLVIIILIKNE